MNGLKMVISIVEFDKFNVSCKKCKSTDLDVDITYSIYGINSVYFVCLNCKEREKLKRVG